MLKYIFIILNVAFVAGFKEYLINEKTEILQTIPTSTLTGTEFIQEITIKKPNDLRGFAKFEQHLPKGFVAVPIDIKDGHFSQNEYDVVKVIWYKMSDLNEFTIKFRIIVDYETSLNEYAISSRFSYLENNERKSITSNISKILVEKGANEPKEEEIIQVHDTTLHRALTDNIDKMLRESGVACTQVSEMINKSEAKIDIRIIKGKISGFAKIEEPLCEGLTAININNGGGVFSFADGKVKYVWTNLAPDQNVTVSFKLIRNKDAGWLNRCTVEGEFAYLSGEKSLRCDFNSITIDFNKGITVANVPMPASAAAQMASGNSESIKPTITPLPSFISETTAVKKAEIPVITAKVTEVTQTKSEPVNPIIPSPTIIETTSVKKLDQPVTEKKIAEAEQTIITEPVEKNTDIASKKEDPSSLNSIEKFHNIASKSNDQSNTLVNENNTAQIIAGLVFKVQVCATQKSNEASFIKSRYKLPDEVMAEMHEGWHKFTIGGYPQYSAARDKRMELAPYNLPGPFVTAYNNGSRITVQEALMISKQQWVK